MEWCLLVLWILTHFFAVFLAQIAVWSLNELVTNFREKSKLWSRNLTRSEGGTLVLVLIFLPCLLVVSFFKGVSLPVCVESAFQSQPNLFYVMCIFRIPPSPGVEFSWIWPAFHILTCHLQIPLKKLKIRTVSCHLYHNHTHIYIAPLRGGFRGAIT